MIESTKIPIHHTAIHQYFQNSKGKLYCFGDVKQLRYDKVYMKMAEEFAKLSYAKRHKVGCIIVSPNGQIISQGYNGTPSGRDNICEYINEAGELVTKPEVLHAESNAIGKCAKWCASTDQATLYVTLSPCINCAKLIIQAGIKRVVYKEEYHDTEGIDLMRSVGIVVDCLNVE